MKGPKAVVILGAALALALAGSALAAPTDVTLEVLSNRADLVSGGTALVEAAVPAGASTSSLTLTLNGDDVSKDFAVRPDGRFYGRVTGLRDGDNELTATLPDGRGARLTITNHPIGGPVFAGPQTQPWTCTTDSNGLGPAKDAQCDAPTVYSFSYKDAASGQFMSYDPSSPPAASAIATATTDQGKTVPYIIRDERGTIDRGIYDIAVLFDPSKSWQPWAPQSGWDHKLAFKFGGGCAPGHSQQSAQDPKDDMFLSRGYMVAVSSIDVNGNSCNPTTSAESMMMIKEHIVDGYGFIRFTMGDGCSGGAEQQHSIVDQYPGLLDGIRPECTFPDLWTIGTFEKWDCQLLENYFDNVSPQLWGVEADRAAVLGGDASQSMCVEITKALNGADQDWNPTGSGCGVTGSWMYDPVKNPHGTRCTLQDYNVNALGRRPGDGFANLPVDEVGVQWGLHALYAGTITPEQFVDLNEKVGGLNVDFTWQPQRTAGDVAGIERMYQADELSYGADWAKVPEIEARTDDTYDEHSNVMHLIDRARLDAAAGDHANSVFWQEPVAGPFGMPTPDMHQLTFQVMDQWLTNIEKDQSDLSQRAKVLRDKPPEAKDGCYANGQPVGQSACDDIRTSNVLPIMVAGMPMAANILKCRLKPLRQADYEEHNVHFTADQWARLVKAFPSGVCDYSQPGVGQQPPRDAWLSFDVTGGRPLGAAPRSVPLGAAGPGAALLPAQRGCVDRRRFAFRLHRPRGVHVVRVAVYVNGRRTRVVRGRDVHRIAITRLPKGRFVVTIVATRSNGSKLISTRTYRGCTKSRPRSHAVRPKRHRRSPR